MEFNKNQPIYFQIADYICEKILLRLWKEGDRLLSVREMAAGIQVNPNTVMRAYAFLQEMEIISNQRGIGFFVAENGFEKAKQFVTKQVVDFEMQELFRKMNYLNISSEELLKQFAKYAEKNGGNDNEQKQ